ncbi:MAG: ornithine cyclodeaminase [Pseudomonadota bacterium]
MTIIVPAEAEKRLDWISLTEALAAGHDLPPAEIGDTFLYRDPDTLLSRAAWIDGLGALVKSATVFPGNPQYGKPVIGGAAVLLSDLDGSLEALVDFHLLTKWKTAGDSLLSARRLAPPVVAQVLIVGAGAVAASLIEAYGAAFPDAAISVWNRTAQRADALASLYPAVSVAADLAEAVANADVIATSTMTTEPIIRGAWLRPGQHLDLIGAYRHDMREVDNEALRRGRLFVDSLATTVDHIGELKIPIAEGVIGHDDIIADFYDLGSFTRSPEDITISKNGGGAHLDLMTARYILDRWQDS